MNGDNGAQNFALGLDLDALMKDANTAKQTFEQLTREIQAEGQKVDSVLKDLAANFDTSTLSGKIVALHRVIADNEAVITSSREQIEEWGAKAKEAFAAGDIATFNKLTSDVMEQCKQIADLTAETDKYKQVLTDLETAAGRITSVPTVEAPQYYASEEEYKHVIELRQAVADLKRELSNISVDDSGFNDLNQQLIDAQDRLVEAETKAAEAASVLGEDLGGRASEASQKLYDLNQAVSTQTQVVEELEKAVAEARDRMNELNDSEDSGAALNAQVEYQALVTSLQNASNELANLKAAQTDASSAWTNISNEVKQYDSVLVKMLGGQQKYNAIFGQLPPFLQSAVTGLTGMTGAAKAFIATPLGAVLAALVLAMQTLKSWFDSTVEGQLKFAEVSGYISGVLGQLKEISIKVGKAIFEAFSNPKKAITELWDAIKTNIVNRFKALGDMASDLGRVLKAAFTFDTDGLKTALKDLGESFLQFGTGVENAGEKIANWASSVNDAAKATSEIKRAERELEIDISEWQKRKAELERIKGEAAAKMYDTNASKEERQKALASYKAAIAEQMNEETKLADRKIALQKQSMALTSNSIEDENKLRDLQAERTRIQAQGARELASLARRSNSIDNATITPEIKRELELAKELRTLQEQNRQAEIDAMNEGAEKKLAAIKFNYDKQIAVIEEQEAKWRAAQAGDLTKEQQDAITAAKASAEVAANKESLDTMLEDVKTYEQRRLEIEEEFKQKRDALYEKDAEGKVTDKLKSGATQGNVDELAYQQDETLKALDEEFASREESYQAWCNAISTLTLEQLESVLQKAQEDLEAAKKSGASGKELATAQAKVATAQKAVTKVKAEDAVSPGKRTIKEWEDLYKTLVECEREFESLGDSVGGVAGEAIKAAGSVMSSSLTMINGIVQLVNMSSVGMQGTATAAATAISTVEKASVILTVISAAMSIAMAIINLFNSDKNKQEQIEALQGEIDQLQWYLDNQELVRIQEKYGEAIDLVRNKLQETYTQLINQRMALGQIRSVFDILKLSQDAVAQSATKVAEAYANIAYSADKALGAAKYDEAKKQLENIARQQILINEQIELERSKKKSDDDAIKDWEQKIEELGGQAVDLINELVEDIIGGSVQDITSDLGDAIFDAFKEGEDAAEAWGKKVNDVVADVMKRMLVSKYLEEPLGEIFDRYKQKWFKDGNFAGIDAVIESMSGFANDLNKVGDDFAAIWDTLPESVRKMFTSTDEMVREASQGTTPSVTQESMDEQNGRLTAIQGHTYSIAESARIMQENSSEILRSVLAIESHTARLESVENNIKSVKNTLDDISMKGVKLI